MAKELKDLAKEILGIAGIEINGKNPWDIQVHDERLYKRIISEGSLGLGESYMDGWWDANELDQFFYKLLSSKLDEKVKEKLSLNTKTKIALKFLTSKLMNTQSISKSKKVAEIHYNLGNDFYQNMLDSQYMQYTCSYWKDVKNLQDAQIKKLDIICKKIHIPTNKDKKSKEKILELGSGFGGFALFAAKNYNCEVTSYNISKEQVLYAREKSKNLPIEIKEEDYRNALNLENKEKFDKVVSIGMMEHVGQNNYRNFMKLSNYCLKDKGLFFIHTIGSLKSNRGTDPWLNKYIFPGGQLPSSASVIKAAEGYFVLEDFQNIGHYYDKTLMAWYDNFNKNWPKFKEEYGERFYRMWKYYLLCCAGSFRAGNICLFQFVFSKGNFGKTYDGVR